MVWGIGQITCLEHYCYSGAAGVAIPSLSLEVYREVVGSGFQGHFPEALEACAQVQHHPAF